MKRSSARLTVFAFSLLACTTLASTMHSASGGTRSAISPVINIAHRGASGLAPEHTFPAWDLALRQGADYIEQDLQMTKDGVLVVLHDSTLDRTARGPTENCTGPVAEKTLEQLSTCEVGSWFNDEYPGRARASFEGLPIPTLEDVFHRYGRKTNYYIEIKDPQSNPGIEEELLRLLDRYGLRRPAVTARRVLIQSFIPSSLQKIHAMDPDLPLIQLYAGMSSPVVSQTFATTSEYAVGVGPSYSDVDESLVAAAHDLDLEVHPYTVDSAKVMDDLIEFGVDGMFTNFPRRLARRLQPTG